MKIKSQDVIKEILNDLPIGNEKGNLADTIGKVSVYQLMQVAVNDLEADESSVNEDTVNKYLELEVHKIQPIVVHKHVNGSSIVVDGIHRLNAIKRKNEKYIMAYVGMIFK